MSTSTEAVLPTGQLTAELIRAVYGHELSGRMRTPGELRLAVFEWILDLSHDPVLAARSILERRSSSHAAALPRTVIALLEEIANGRLDRFRRARRNAASAPVN
jgi:hypothetical protein